MSDYGSDDLPAQKKRDTPRKIRPRMVTEERLYNAAIHYLQRFSATEAHLATILKRKVKRWTEEQPDFAIGADEKISKTIQKIVALGFVNDAVFAESRTRSLRRQGKSSTTIRMHLKQKGVTDDTVLQDAMQKGDHSFIDEVAPDQSIDDMDDTASQEAEKQALLRFIKRKRLLQSDDPEQQKKDIAKILRGGFSWALVRDLVGKT
jgi:regulatory protein